MAQVVVSYMDEDVKVRLKRLAERHGHSMEEEIRQILRNATKDAGRPAAKIGLLVTNVLSQLMREVPDRPVAEWLDRQAAESIWITSITVLEARLGLALLPKGKRRQTHESAFNSLMAEDLERRVLDFDQPAAESAAQLAAERQRNGQTVDIRDTQIAGIVSARRAELATRNVRHFSDAGIDVINPRDTPD